MRVRIHKAREQIRVAQLHDFLRRRCRSARPYVGNASTFDANGPVCDWRVRDRQDPLRRIETDGDEGIGDRG